MSNNYIFLSRLVPKEMEDEVYKKSNKSMLDAANALEWHIYNGLCKNLKENIIIFNILAVASFPQFFKDIFIKKRTFSTNYNKNNINIGFCNIKLIRQWSCNLNAYIELKKFFKNNPNIKIVFIYTMSVSFLKALKKLKEQYSFKICCIVADLPNMGNLSNKMSLYIKIAGKYYTKVSYSLQKNVDYYVLLTKYMADYMHIKKPFCVMEGIATDYTEFGNIDIFDSKEKIIFYSGTLNERFGVWNLVKAFQLITDKDYRLVLCGVGDCEERIKEVTKEDSRICFFGQLPRNQVLKIQKSSSVLVNPRQNLEEFTKYSFPSKNLEYLSSGVPLIAYKLDGIPDEYDDYIFYVGDNSISALKNKIMEVSKMEEYKLKSYRERVLLFLLKEKSEVPQTKKIVELLK